MNKLEEMVDAIMAETRHMFSMDEPVMIQSYMLEMARAVIAEAERWGRSEMKVYYDDHEWRMSTHYEDDFASSAIDYLRSLDKGEK